MTKKTIYDILKKEIVSDQMLVAKPVPHSRLSKKQKKEVIDSAKKMVKKNNIDVKKIKKEFELIVL